MRLIPIVLLLTACATSTAVDMTEPRRIVGTEELVRVDAQVTGEEIWSGARIPITYEITNQRTTAIAVADLVPETSYDRQSHTFTVSVGSEVPGNTMLPRLVSIAPGEKKTFTVVGRIAALRPLQPGDPTRTPPPADFRLRVNFLGDTTPFQALIGIKEVGVADAQLADELFPLWLERNEVVYTNAIPMRWSTGPREPTPDRAPARRRSGRGGV
jgi:hypothetical protein